MKGTQTRKEEVKLSLSADDMTLHTEKLKTPPKKLLDLINKFNSIVGYKNQPFAFPYTNNK